MEAYFNWYVEASKNIIRYTLLLPLEKLTIISKDFQIGKILWGFWKLTLFPSESLCSFVDLRMSTTMLSSLLSISLWTSVLWWWAWVPAESNYASNGLRKMSIIIMAIWKKHFFFKVLTLKEQKPFLEEIAFLSLCLWDVNILPGHLRELFRPSIIFMTGKKKKGRRRKRKEAF